LQRYLLLENVLHILFLDDTCFEMYFSYNAMTFYTFWHQNHKTLSVAMCQQ